jgi:hypothetical protein
MLLTETTNTANWYYVVVNGKPTSALIWADKAKRLDGFWELEFNGIPVAFIHDPVTICTDFSIE